MNNKKFGFTLAEVLITLAIIGVVAALTIPTLVQNYKKHEATTRLKRFYATMTQAIKMSEVQNGACGNWEKMVTSKNEDGSTNFDRAADEAILFYNKYIQPYLRATLVEKGKSIEEYNNVTDQLSLYQMNDGTLFRIHNGACIDFMVDINGFNSPNQYGRDLFDFLLCTSSAERVRFCGNPNTAFCPMFSNIPNKTREYYLGNCISSPQYCAGLLWYDNYEFKNDYPYKL